MTYVPKNPRRSLWPGRIAAALVGAAVLYLFFVIVLVGPGR